MIFHIKELESCKFLYLRILLSYQKSVVNLKLTNININYK